MEGWQSWQSLLIWVPHQLTWMSPAPWPRTILLMVLIVARGGTFFLEQPSSSLMSKYFRFEWLIKQVRAFWLHSRYHMSMVIIHIYVYFEYHTMTVTCAPLGLQDRLVDGDVWISIAKKASWIWEQSQHRPHRSGRLYKGAAGQGQEEEWKLQTCHPLSNQERDNRLCWHERPQENTVRAPIWKELMFRNLWDNDWLFSGFPIFPSLFIPPSTQGIPIGICSAYPGCLRPPCSSWSGEACHQVRSGWATAVPEALLEWLGGSKSDGTTAVCPWQQEFAMSSWVEESVPSRVWNPPSSRGNAVMGKASWTFPASIKPWGLLKKPCWSYGDAWKAFVGFMGSTNSLLKAPRLSYNPYRSWTIKTVI